MDTLITKRRRAGLRDGQERPGSSATMLAPGRMPLLNGDLPSASSQPAQLPRGSLLQRLPVRRAIHFGLRGARRMASAVLWLGERVCFYALPPFVHSCLKHSTPRILHPSVRQHFVRRIKDKIGPKVAPPPPVICEPVHSANGDVSVATPEPEPPVRLNPALAALEQVLAATACQRVNLYRELYTAPETTRDAIEEKARRCRAALQHSFLDRVRLYRELARLEELIGNHLMSCTYRLRALRLLGEDVAHDLAYLRRRLPLCGFPAAAAAAVALYSGSSDTEGLCVELLEQALERHRQPPLLDPFALVEDRRTQSRYRVSIIVSLYNAASKLPLFLHTLACQKLVRSGQAEIILIDSASPADEYQAFHTTRLDVPLQYVFARTARREPIQTAWNRGIGMSRAPYLTFLGVDEAIVPDALTVLADELDANPEIDWVQSDSIVTEVDEHGTFVRDVVPYDRDGYSQGMVYLDTCFLSYVGALYRRSIHDRVGYYDGSFRAAGDTEFKLRVLPFIKSRHVPRMLGVFLNYPEERTTQSPLAEVEDLRAWYLHRSPGGVRYAFDRLDPKQALDLLEQSLSYRKSFAQHRSSDVDYAFSLAQYLDRRAKESLDNGLARDVATLVRAYRCLDHVPDLGHDRFQMTLARTLAHVERAQGRLRGTPALDLCNFAVTNDNRYEQHSNIW